MTSRAAGQDVTPAAAAGRQAGDRGAPGQDPQQRDPRGPEEGTPPGPWGLARGAWVAAACLVAVLVAAGGRYGFHRDELYFVEAGHHPAFGYPDQPPLVPLLATAWHTVTGGSLWAFRVLPALVAGAAVLVAAATSRRLGGTAADQTWTATATALATGVVAVGHLFSTSTFDLALTAGCVLLLLRALDLDTRRSWVALGLLAGLALQVKTLPATVLAACGVALLLAGPRRPLRRPGPWIAAGLAVLLAAPNLIWQAVHGWPQLALSRAIAAGSSGTSVDRWAVVPFQLLLVGPVLAVPLVLGVARLLVGRAVRPHRWVGAAYLVLLAVLVLSGGKPYYTLGLLPALLAAGVPLVRRWCRRGRAVLRRRVVAAALAVHVVVSSIIVLPVLPAAVLASTPVVDVNYDAGETVGWDELVDTVTGVVAGMPEPERARAVVLTANYGEAGALDRARRRGADLPPVYSGHNAYGDWGPPPAWATRVVLVGHRGDDGAARVFSGCRVVARLGNAAGVDNDEAGQPVRLCGGLTRPWPALWPAIRHLG